ncbi:MAG: hypothetical protein LEGION0398_MBIBDBAK_00652 [Legionellaceae bacterium]
MSQGTSITLTELIKLESIAHGLSVTNTLVTNSIQGTGYLSHFRGRGMEFDQVRQYQIGDDIHTIDWRVTARMGKLHTKVFQEEHQNTILFLIDDSLSMQFGTKVAYKSVIAAKIAAILAWIAAKKGDRLGSVIFSEFINEITPFKSSQPGLFQLFHALTKPKKLALLKNENPLNQALQQILFKNIKTSLIFIISDFYQMNEETQKMLRCLQQNNELAAICIYDPLEKTLPTIKGKYSFISHEGQEFIIDTANSTIIKNYQIQFEEQQNKLFQFFSSLKSPLLKIATNDDLRIVLKAWLKG